MRTLSAQVRLHLAQGGSVIGGRIRERSCFDLQDATTTRQDRVTLGWESAGRVSGGVFSTSSGPICGKIGVTRGGLAVKRLSKPSKEGTSHVLARMASNAHGEIISSDLPCTPPSHKQTHFRMFLRGWLRKHMVTSLHLIVRAPRLHTKN